MEKYHKENQEIENISHQKEKSMFFIKLLNHLKNKKKFNIHQSLVDYSKSNKNFKSHIIKSLLAFVSIFILIVITMNIFSSEKEKYGYSSASDFNKKEDNQIEVKAEENTTEEVVRVAKRALDEEVSAQASYKNISYIFNVNRQVKTTEKIHLFNSTSWSNFDKIIDENTVFNVNLMTSPGGFMMYQISDGEYAGKFITANPNLVEILTSNDGLNLEFITKAIAIKLLENQTIYSDKQLTKITTTGQQNAILNISGYGIVNNRLVYYMENGTFAPINFNIQAETQRQTTKTTQNTKQTVKNTNQP